MMMINHPNRSNRRVRVELTRIEADQVMRAINNFSPANDIEGGFSRWQARALDEAKRKIEAAISAALILLAVLFTGSPARADAFQYDVTIGLQFGNPGTLIRGAVVTDCNACALHPADFISWSFQVSGGLPGFAGDASTVFEHATNLSDPAFSTLVATPTQLFFVGLGSRTGSFGLGFCSDAACDGPVLSFGATHIPQVISDSTISLSCPTIVECQGLVHTLAAPIGVAVPGPIAGVGLPGLVALAAGWLAMRRRRA